MVAPDTGIDEFVNVTFHFKYNVPRVLIYSYSYKDDFVILNMKFVSFSIKGPRIQLLKENTPFCKLVGDT